MRLIIFVVCISLAFGQKVILQNVTEFCNENTSETAQKLSTNENITSPNYPGEYNPNMDCYIRRYTDFPHLKIKFFRVELEPHYDELYIYNGLVSRENIESGAVEPDHTIINMEDEIILGSEVTLRFKSDESAEFTGVAMEISPYGADECADSSGHNCDVNAHCYDVIGGFKCVCKNGFTGDGVSCTDINECVENSKICSNQAVCNNLPGSYKCVCANGYKGDGRICQDIDECASSSKDVNQCSVDAVCSNTLGSYDCTCKAGYKGDGRTCVEKLECSTGEHTCSSNAVCTETQGGYNCNCLPGYVGTGYICIDINECSTYTHNCSPRAICTNLQGGFRCDCKSGFIGDGYTCTEQVDVWSHVIGLGAVYECETGSHNCSENGFCLNINENVCLCKKGFTGDGFTCDDYDECQNNKHRCDVNADCINTPGSYRCRCITGFIGNGYKCAASEGTQQAGEEQSRIHQSRIHQSRIHQSRIQQSRIHQSRIQRLRRLHLLGQQSRGQQQSRRPRVLDINECKTGTHTCSPQAFCKNTKGSFLCRCRKGYSGDGFICNDVDECQNNKHKCNENADCINIPGRYRCQCKAGFVGNGFRCVEKRRRL